MYESLSDLVLETAEIIQPTEHLNVWQAAEKYRSIDNPGSYVGEYKVDKTPYLIEPMELLTSRDHNGLVFVGPAQCAKTDMYFSFLAYIVGCEPADIMLIHMSKTAASDFSMRRYDRFHRDSPKIAKKIKIGTNKDNIFSKSYLNGVLSTLTWPSINELSGKVVPFVWLTDYDRMPQDVDGNKIVYIFR